MRESPRKSRPPEVRASPSSRSSMRNAASIVPTANSMVSNWVLLKSSDLLVDARLIFDQVAASRIVTTQPSYDFLAGGSASPHQQALRQTLRQPQVLSQVRHAAD
jgi:hypothetical protein